MEVTYIYKVIFINGSAYYTAFSFFHTILENQYLRQKDILNGVLVIIIYKLLFSEIKFGIKFVSIVYFCHLLYMDGITRFEDLILNRLYFVSYIRIYGQKIINIFALKPWFSFPLIFEVGKVLPEIINL